MVSIVLEQASFIADSDHTTCVAYVTPEVPTSQDIYKQRQHCDSAMAPSIGKSTADLQQFPLSGPLEYGATGSKM